MCASKVYLCNMNNTTLKLGSWSTTFFAMRRSIYWLMMGVGLIMGQDYYYDSDLTYDEYDEYELYDDYGNNNGLEDIYAGMEATILTKAEVIEVQDEGRTVRLQCEYQSPGEFNSFFQNIVRFFIHSNISNHLEQN